jgi:hypothetical protein
LTFLLVMAGFSAGCGSSADTTAEAEEGAGLTSDIVESGSETGDAGNSAGSGSEQASAATVDEFYRRFLPVWDAARLTGDTTDLAAIASDNIVAQAEAWHSKNEDELADESFLGTVDVVSSAHVEAIDESGQGAEVVDCLEERNELEVTASGLPNYHYIDQTVTITGAVGSWTVEDISVRSPGTPMTGLTCVPDVHAERILEFAPRLDEALDAMISNPQGGVTDEVRELVNEQLMGGVAGALESYEQAGVAPDLDTAEYRYRIVGADTDVDQRIVRVERCAYFPDGERFLSLETGEEVEVPGVESTTSETSDVTTYFVQFSDAFTEEFVYRLYDVSVSPQPSECGTDPTWATSVLESN